MSARVPGFSYDGRRKVARFVLYVPGLKGRARRKKILYGITRDEALRRYSEFREQVSRRSVEPIPRPSGRRLTFGEFIEGYLDRIATGLSSKTDRNYRYTLEKHLLPIFGSLPLDRISSAAVQDFIADLKKRGYSPSTIADYVRVLKVFLYQALEREEIETFPLRRRLKLEKIVLPCLELTPEEKDRFLVAFESEKAFREKLLRHRTRGKIAMSPRFRSLRVFGGSMSPEGEAARIYFERFRASKPLFVVALETGFRRSDLLSLRWANVDFQNGWIRVRTQKTKEEVTIPISAACRQALLESRNRSVVSDRVFLEESGRPLSETRIRRHFAIAKEIAGITRRFRFHDLRHTFASTLASRGVSLQVIAKALGHASVQMSERYARPSQEAMEAIRGALDVAAHDAKSSSTGV